MDLIDLNDDSMHLRDKKFQKFVIFAPSYSGTSGGIVALHKLCDLLNKNGYEASLYPAYKTHIIHQESWLKAVLSILYASFKFRFLRPFKINIEWNTPVFKGRSGSIPDDHVVIYSEGVANNPLRAAHVVRWLLHQPGYNYGFCCFGNSELVVTYAESYLKGFQLPLSRLAKTLLYIPPVNLTHYLSHKSLPDNQRRGIAYCLRKGKNKVIVHKESDAILIDHLSHEEIAEVFKRVKTFISYDSRTAFSLFAAVAGADSIVIPDPDVDIDTWEPQERYRYGISYGFDNIEWARKTRPLLLKQIQDDIAQTDARIHSFVNEVNEYFPCPPYR